MRIAVNLFSTSPASSTGAFVYIEQILPALFRADATHDYYLFGEPETIRYFAERYGGFPNVSFHAFGIARGALLHPLRAARKLAAKIRHDYRAREHVIADEIRSVMRDERIDIYFSPTGIVFPRGLDVKIIATIHDLQHEYFPENFPSRYLAERRENCRYAVERSDRLIAVSEATKRSLVEKCGAAPEKIAVIHHAPQEMGDEPATADLPREFVFYPAALWSHKNHRVLIKAMGILKDRFPALCAVCAGITKGGGLKKELESLTATEGLADRVRFLGYVPDEELRVLHTRAKMLVYPSAFEGFGIPLVEAMSFGVPVIAADNSSIPEVVGDAGLLVRTGDAIALAEAIARVLTDGVLRDALIRKGRERAKLFSWEKAARETLAVFRSLGSE